MRLARVGALHNAKTYALGVICYSAPSLVLRGSWGSTQIQEIDGIGGQTVGGAEFSRECTHVVVPAVAATANVLAALAAGKFVLSIDWLEASIAAGLCPHLVHVG